MQICDLVVLALALVFFGGWVGNIAKLFAADAVTGMEIARMVGVVIPPLGAVLGWF